jgi:hypothetical protein
MWVRKFDESSSGRNIFSDSSCNIYSLGDAYNSTLLILDSNGTNKTKIEYYPSSLLTMILDHSYKLLALGDFQGNSIDLDPTIGVNLFSSTSASFIEKLCTDSYHLTFTTDAPNAYPSAPAHLTATYYPGATYVWIRDNVVYPSNGTNTITITFGGTFRVEMYGLGCPSISDTDITIFPITAVPELTLDNFFLTPNPVTNTLYIQTIQAGSLEIADMMGRVIDKFQIPSSNYAQLPTKFQIDVSGLSDGVYIVRYIMNDGNTETAKLVKE